jgi:hypothetical protein
MAPILDLVNGESAESAETHAMRSEAETVTARWPDLRSLSAALQASTAERNARVTSLPFESTAVTLLIIMGREYLRAQTMSTENRPERLKKIMVR